MCSCTVNSEKVLHLYSVTFTINQLCTFSFEEISIFHGSIAGQVSCYVVYFKRGLSKQPLSLEFFVFENFEPIQLLPYYDYNDKATVEAFDALKTSINIQHLVAEAGIHMDMPKLGA